LIVAIQFYFVWFIFILSAIQARLAGRGIVLSTCPFVLPCICSFICCQTCEHSILKTKNWFWCISSNGSRGKDIKRGGREVKRSHESKD